ncbi:hypothetical protein [Haloferula sp. BvORR071]|uniref:hypothetical protein n=1 Tax=Haloferula sp. BvORR071 TaxID=1396141 RepID=UPI00054FB188|nr:hypothetical protein [Haloferula sp. BvORR071]
MKPPSLFRSLVFWGGLLVMGFAVWGWRDSTVNSAKLTMGPCEIESWACGMAVKYRPSQGGRWKLSYQPRERSGSASFRDPSYDCHAPKPPVTVALETFRFARPGVQDLAEAKGFYIPVGVTYGPRGIAGGPEVGMDVALRDHYLESRPPFSSGAGPRGWIAFLPDWLLLLAVALVWQGLLYWRAGRWRRMDARSYEEHRSSAYPLWRSPVFWCGLAALTFTLWLWRDSTRQSSYIESGNQELQSWASAVIWMRHADAPVAWHMGRRPHYRPNEVSLGEMRFAWPAAIGVPGLDKTTAMPGRRPLTVGPGEDPALRGLRDHLEQTMPARLSAGARIVFIPHWMILLVEVVLWGGLLAWRVWRWHRGQVEEKASGAEAATPEMAAGR